MAKAEILSPAGSLESLKAGVNCGADAVYLGLGSLNARRNAQNFDDKSLLEAAKFCRARGIKIYLTINTVVYDRELPEVLETLELACKCGVDAVITQDLAVAKLVRQVAPGLKLHASTQMAIHNVSGAKALLELGFSRVVLAREMSRDEISAVIRQVPIETEAFVHGALCMSVSGQCYLSSVIGERSGNRGLCAQPCRLPFSARKGDDGFALSLKDLTLAKRVDQLTELGVTAFKIEGRMKRPEYVAAAVTAFREALDGKQPDMETLEAAFSRGGFTQGYFDGRPGKEMFGIRQKEDAMAGLKVYKSLAAMGSKERGHVAIDFAFSMKAGEKPSLTVKDDRGNSLTVLSEQLPQVAKDHPTDEVLVHRGLEKTGGTFYSLKNLSCDLDEGLAFPVSQLNLMRRQALEELTELRGEVKPSPFSRPSAEALPIKGAEPDEEAEAETLAEASVLPARSNQDLPALYAQVRQFSQITPALAKNCKWIFAPLGEFIRQKDHLPASCRDKLVISLPRVSFGDDRATLTAKLEDLRNLGLTHVSAGNLGGLHLGKELGFTVHGEFGLNITNTLAAEEYARLGLCDCVLSFELSLLRLRALKSPIPAGFWAYGSLPLMLTRNCPIKAGSCGDCKQQGILTDRRRETFEVRCTERGYSEMFNSIPVYLADRWKEFAGLDFGLLSFTGESREEVDQVVDDYTLLFSARETITRGLNYRTVK